MVEHERAYRRFDSTAGKWRALNADAYAHTEEHMNTLTRLISVFILTLATVCYAETNKDAVKNADEFLAALKVLELPEGKQAISAASWSVNMDKLPVLLEQEKLFDAIFQTDAPGIKGYKRLIQAKVQSKGGMQLSEKYLLVSYRGKQTGRWRVWEMREISGIDVDHEIDAAKTSLGDTKYVPDQVNYRNYGYWLALGGKILAAKQALETALAMDKRNHGQYFPQERCQNEVTTLQSICGQ